MPIINVVWPQTVCRECQERFDGVFRVDSDAFELRQEFECPNCGTIIEREITLWRDTDAAKAHPIEEPIRSLLLEHLGWKQKEKEA